MGRPGLFASQRLIAYGMLAPALITLLAVMIAPMFIAIDASVRNWILYRPEIGRPFIGLDNYITILGSGAFQDSLRVSLVFTLLSTALTLLIGLGQAMLLNQEIKGKGIIRTILILPMVITPVVVAFGWRFMYNEGTGLITAYALPSLGINVMTILADPTLALYGIIIADVWNQTPLVFMILLAALEALPQEPYEAARVDGASSWQIFRTITLPLIRPAILIAVLLRTIDTFKIFDLIWVMTSGGPGTATTTLNIRGYETAFVAYRMGEASAFGIIILYIILGISLIYIRILVGRGK